MIQQKTMPPAPVSIAREQQLIRLLIAFLTTGIIFMVLPGTFLGVWNLFSISGARSAASVPVTLIQAHGHAQLFGWIGSFILGIGFYSLPNLRRVSAWSFIDGWLIYSLWTAGVTLRWIAGVYLWHWKILLPLSALLELSAVAVFLARSIQGHQMHRRVKTALDSWAVLVVAGTLGLLASQCLNLFESLRLAIAATAPAFPSDFDSAYLILSIWGFPVPIAWGFTAHWMPVFLGIKPPRQKLMLISLALVVAGIAAALTHGILLSAIILLAGAATIVFALCIFEPPIQPPKTQGVHSSFTIFMRIAYAWLLVAALVLVWSALDPASTGVGGAGRHALTVGFLLTMVFSVAPRVLPAFIGRKSLFSPRLMFVALLLANCGCFLRVLSEIVAYQHYASWAWMLLPVSATLELTGVVVFAVNMVATFRQPPLLASAG